VITDAEVNSTQIIASYTVYQ